MKTIRILILAVLALAASNAVQAGEERFKWWHSDRVKAEVGLTDAQSAQLEEVFQALLPRMRTEKAELDRLQDTFSRQLTEATLTESEIGQAIDRLEGARAQAGKTRLLMLYRMYRVLSPDQRVKLRQLHDRSHNERRRSGSDGHGGQFE